MEEWAAKWFFILHFFSKQEHNESHRCWIDKLNLKLSHTESFKLDTFDIKNHIFPSLNFQTFRVQYWGRVKNHLWNYSWIYPVGHDKYWKGKKGFDEKLHYCLLQPFWDFKNIFLIQTSLVWFCKRRNGLSLKRD